MLLLLAESISDSFAEIIKFFLGRFESFLDVVVSFLDVVEPFLNVIESFLHTSEASLLEVFEASLTEITEADLLLMVISAIVVASLVESTLIAVVVLLLLRIPLAVVQLRLLSRIMSARAELQMSLSPIRQRTGEQNTKSRDAQERFHFQSNQKKSRFWNETIESNWTDNSQLMSIFKLARLFMLRSNRTITMFSNKFMKIFA